MAIAPRPAVNCHVLWGSSSAGSAAARCVLSADDTPAIISAIDGARNLFIGTLLRHTHKDLRAIHQYLEVDRVLDRLLEYENLCA